MAADARGRSTEAGETLTETLMTMVLMSLVVLGLLAGLFAVARIVDRNNRVTHAGNTAQSFVEQLKQPVNVCQEADTNDCDEAGASWLDGFEYVECADAGTYREFEGVLPDQDEGDDPDDSAYEVRIADVQYASSIPAGSSAITWSDACPSVDLGLQLITVEVTATRGSQAITETVPLVKRDARCEYSPEYESTDEGPC